jgi:molecular chaperone DnaJ
VKNSYKKLALQFHPDKNTSPDATERFQEIGAAYSRVVKHIEHPGHGEGHYWDEDGDEGDEMDLDFFM